LFPFQLVPLEQSAIVTLRQYCPSAATDNGRPLADHLESVRLWAEEGGLAAEAAPPKPVVAGVRSTWNDMLSVAEVLERLTLDPQYPLARRLVHGLQFCDWIERKKFSRFDDGEMTQAPEETFEKQSAEIFRQPRRPERAARLVFRQILFDYFRLHPRYQVRGTWRERRRLIRAAVGFAWGKGRLTFLDGNFPPASFEGLERPLGAIDEDILAPLQRFFERAAAAKQYLLIGDGSWPLLDCFRALAASHAAAMWLLRLSCGDRPPVLEDVLMSVRAIDRGLGFDPLNGRRHLRRIVSLARLGELPRILAWYGR
jgi:hypothetical protein